MAYQNFSYFDQFLDIKIDLNKYNNSLPISFSNEQPVFVTIKNLFDHIALIDNYKKNYTFFEKYQIKEGDSPESISRDFYTVVDFWWTILLINKITNPLAEWTMTENQIIALANKMVTTENIYTYQTYFDLFVELNEKRRNIIVLKNAYIGDLVWSFKNILIQNHNENITR